MINSKETDLRPNHIEVSNRTKYEMMIKITVLLLIVKLKYSNKDTGIAKRQMLSTIQLEYSEASYQTISFRKVISIITAIHKFIRQKQLTARKLTFFKKHIKGKK